MMTKNIIISLFFVFIFLFGGYFIWRGQSVEKPEPTKSADTTMASQGQPANSASQNNQPVAQTNTNPLSSLKPDPDSFKKNNGIPVNWQTYTNKRLGFTFHYPSSWSKNGEDVDVIN